MKLAYSLFAQSNKRIIATVIILFLVFSVIAVFGNKWKLLAICWIAFASMAGAIPWGINAALHHSENHRIAGYGIASGAMITSAALFLIPVAIHQNATYGGLGIAIGILAGFAMHTLNHDVPHSALPVDSVVLELTSHALAAGLIMGLIYTAMPGLSLLLGVAIISHKAPAGYAAARQLKAKKSAPWLLLIPACSIGLTALPISFARIAPNPVLNALIFGFATGVFFHIAFDFLPESETSETIHDHATEKNQVDHASFPHRRRAVLYTFAGSMAVILLWYISR